MKRYAIILALLLIGSSAFADTFPDDKDYRDMDELRAKLVRMRREMDKFIRDIAAPAPGDQAAQLVDFGQDVRVDVSETPKEVVVRADLPGMEKDKINITLENSKILKIEGSREIVKKETAPGMVRQERMQGAFARSIELPTECMNDGIKATYKDGVLEMTIPKKQQVPEKAVTIKVQ